MRGEHGAVAVEFAILLPVFLVLMFGIIDFGHCLYMKQVMTSASREGARYATKYHTDASGHHIIPSQLSPSIADYVINTSAQNGGVGGYGLASFLPDDANSQVVNADLTDAIKSPGYTTGAPGDDITVNITAIKTWWVIGRLIPNLGTSLILRTATVMKCE